MIQSGCHSWRTVQGCRNEWLNVIFTPPRAVASGDRKVPLSQGRPGLRGVIVLTVKPFGEKLEVPRSRTV